MKNIPDKNEPFIPYGQHDASFQAAGGIVGIEKLVNDFYHAMDTLKEASAIRAMHARDLAISREKLARFLCGWLGEPRRYQEKYGPINIPHIHKPLKVTRADRDAWLLCMDTAIDQQHYDASFAKYLKAQFRVPADRILSVGQNERGGSP